MAETPAQRAPNPFLPKDAPAFASNDASELRRYKGVSATDLISNEAALNLIHAYLCLRHEVAGFGELLRDPFDETAVVIVAGRILRAVRAIQKGQASGRSRT